MTDTLKIYLTSLNTTELPTTDRNIVAKNFKEAVHVDDLGTIVVGKLDTFISSYGVENHKTTIH